MSILKRISFLLLAAVGCFSVSQAQDSIPVEDLSVIDDQLMVVPPLFEYVVAPDELPDLVSRTDYIMDHFWDPFDFKNTSVVDQNALNHAFSVYAQAMAYASEKKVDESVRNVIKKIKNNPGLSYQFAKAAEENLYGPRAELWGDLVFIDFAQNLIDNKKIRESQKKHFKDVVDLLKNSAIGSPLPEFSAVNREGTEIKFRPSSNYTIICFTPSECPDGSYSDLKLDISAVVNDLLEDGELEVDYIVLDGVDKNKSYPDKWNLYSSSDVGSKLDLRIAPSFFVIDRNKKIAGKNLTGDGAISLIEILTGQAK